MSDYEPEIENEEVVDLAEVDDAPEPESPEDEAPEAEADDEQVFEIEIDGEDEEDEPSLVKQLRAEVRERDRKLAELQKATTPKIEVGPKPKFEDFNFDDEAYEAALEKWHDLKRQAESQEKDAERQREQASQQFQKAITNYRTAAAKKGIPNIEEAETAVAEVLGPELVGAIVQYGKNPEMVIAALHKYPRKLNAIAAETDPLKRIRLLWEMESEVRPKMKRNAPPAPERDSVLQGSTAGSVSVDKEEQRLEKIAERTGDYTALFTYRRKKRG